MESSNTAFHWFHVIELQLSLFLFIQSICEETFDLFNCTVDTMLSWAFALDHINYARWMSVFICNLKSLYGKDVYNEFCKGHTSVKKSNRAFSSIGEDHAHEQNNKIIKGDGGVIGIFDHDKALLEWAVCGPAVAYMLQNYLTQTKMIVVNSIKTLRKRFKTTVISFLKIFSIMEIHLLDVNKTWLMLC